MYIYIYTYIQLCIYICVCITFARGQLLTSRVLQGCLSVPYVIVHRHNPLPRMQAAGHAPRRWQDDFFFQDFFGVMCVYIYIYLFNIYLTNYLLYLYI